MTRYIIMVGPAGSGKSTLARFLWSLSSERGSKTILVNFDPAAEALPYDPHVDIRDYVTAKDFIKKGLGPNGALIASVASLINYVDDVKSRIEEYVADIAIIDTPGQLELFAYRSSGPIIVRSIVGEWPSATLYLIDAPFFEDPLSIVSALSLASSVAVRMGLPQVNVASKADLLLPEVIDEVLPRLSEEGYLESLISSLEGVDATIRILALRLAEALTESGFIGQVLPVSIYQDDSIKAVYAKLLQIIAQGEEPGLEPSTASNGG
ncbi:MAG: ATP/GTP-binding protein [Desulfurococcales archaeon]|nr:ATP/GTP-binding protein [Desulfurococcales archaeon]